MKSVKETADIIGFSKTTVARYIKSLGATEAVQNGQTFLYDDAVVKLVIKEISKKNTETAAIYDGADNKDSHNLKQFEKTLQILEEEIKEKNEQLKSKDEQIESLQTILNQQQQLLLYEQQKNTKLLEENIENKRWWQWWK